MPMLRVHRTGREVGLEVTHHKGVTVDEGTGALADGVGAVGIVHEVEGLAKLDEPVNQTLGSLEVHVVVAGAMHDEEMEIGRAHV